MGLDAMVGNMDSSNDNGDSSAVRKHLRWYLRFCTAKLLVLRSNCPNDISGQASNAEGRL